jgi:hypothetical protein
MEMKRAVVVRVAAGLASCAMSVGVMAASGPDVIVGDLSDMSVYNVPSGNDQSITAFAVGTTSCNLGTSNLAWLAAPSNLHPVIGQNIYRYEVVGGVGKFEQIGLSFVKHGFTALQQSLCVPCQTGTPSCNTGTCLAPGCSDPYVSSLNGTQSRLGPRSQVNAATGFYPTDWNSSTNLPTSQWPAPPTGSTPQPDRTLRRRGQAITSDLLTSVHPGAQFVAEGIYVTQDDIASGNGANNGSYRRLNVGGSTGVITMSFSNGTGNTTVRQKYAIQAWKDLYDASVTIQTIDVSGDGRILLAYRVTQLSPTQWAYEYAIENANSDRSVGSFSVPIGPCMDIPTANVAFKDVFYHSGEPYSGTDWTSTKSTTDLTWATQSFATNANANAIRWGTMYNFRFLSDRAPVAGTVALGLFKPGANPTVNVAALVPEPCPPACVADVDDGSGSGTPDGGVTIDDLIYYLSIFESGNVAADVDDGSGTGTTDGGVTIDDLIYFLTRFESGC